MPDPFFRAPFSFSSSQNSLFHRIRDNFQQLLASPPAFPSTANGAPLHLSRRERSFRSGRAQSASLLTHVAIITALVVLATHPPVSNHDLLPPTGKIPSFIPVPSDLLDRLRGPHPSGGTGSGSGHDLLPPTKGNLFARSSIQLVKPTLPHNQNPGLPVPPTILDASSRHVLPPVTNIGIPWMLDQNNSSGRSNGNTIGNGPNDSIGTTPGDFTGQGGPQGPYHPGVSRPVCAYCPDPQYTDEAREAKLQGKVTLRALVGADGRASQIQIVQGIGMGLDERAAQSVRAWRFVPAHDAARRAVPTWVTVEVVFRLI